MRKNSTNTKMAVSRARLGAQQRSQTREAILAAALRVFHVKTPDAAVIEDFIAEAGVSRGSFYNHFKDVDSVLREVAIQLSEEFNNAIRAIFKDTPDPAERMAIGMRHHIRRAAIDPQWGWVIVRVATHRTLDSLMRGHAAPEIKAGLASGRFPALDPQVMSDIIMGAVFEAMKSELEGKAAFGHAEKVAAGVLRAFGLTFADAEEVAKRPIPPLVFKPITS